MRTKQLNKKYKLEAFTLVEMLVVLLIISVLMLLFVPNLSKQKEAYEEYHKKTNKKQKLPS